MKIKKLAVAAGAVGAVGALLLTATPASADYAPGPNDVVGVGSDTVQNVIDFLVDGDYAGNTGYNLGKLNRVVNFDATPDANARLAYGSFGLNGTSAATSNCAPGTGGTAGTGNNNSTHVGDRPCVLNPTIVLRAGTKPVLRPNGSGAGFNALKADVALQTAALPTVKANVIDFARRSSSALDGSGTYASVNVGRDGLYMLTSSTTHAGAVSNAQLAAIYKCQAGFTDWSSASLGGTGAGTVIPILPQVGSGTRSSFLTLIGVSEGQLGGCVINAEENDPEAIDATTSPIDAIEPMSSGRLNLYKGLQGPSADSATPVDLAKGGYFTDPSCAYGVTSPKACTTAGGATNLSGYTGAASATTITNTPGAAASDVGKVSPGDAVSGTGIGAGAKVVSVTAAGSTPTIITTITLSVPNSGAVSGSITFTAVGNILNPNVKYWAPGGSGVPALATDGSAIAGTVRNLWVYFRTADIQSRKRFQPGGTQNWVRALFYNPCSGTDLNGNAIGPYVSPTNTGGCTSAGAYGPGGSPYLLQGYALASSGGVDTSNIENNNNAFGAFVPNGA